MKKNTIKTILRESFNVNESEGNNTEKDYAEIQRKLDGTMLKASQVMAAAGLGNPDDATDRSLFSKKLRREKNDEGGLYQFNDEELGTIMKVINNPASYLNTKN
jgi:hypothetical protein